MEWNLKATSWDLSDFVEETVTNTYDINGNGSSGKFGVDLKLGRVGNSGEVPSSSKKARPNKIGTCLVLCLVDGCDSDLSKCKDYHRRHKVCELHSKSAEVMINGLRQRFCQQCSRFHSLEEFDDGKRSCRTRLDRHNRRRRKPQPDPLSRSRSYFSNYLGSQMLPFSSLQVYPSTAVVKATWPGVNDSMIESRCLNPHSPAKQSLVLGSSSSNYREGKQCTFLHGEDQTPAKASVCQPVLGAVAPFLEGNVSCHSMLCDRLTTQVQDSDCALSLLSSPLSHTSGIGSSNMVQPQPFPLVQSLGPSLQNYVIEPMGSVIANVSETTTVPGSGESSGSEAPQTLPFRWQ
ncbi:SQUAMOSA PROMOTER-BINDING PROTEIN LIKE 13, SQUAMOSA PROMOTER-BINDING PROTEIN LIKE 13B [Hibiscus trionum]|uniref:SQUAMOSA PROMOTER-BINDING PROTEIN LIKE 13, SQUAMOSA PROMOTER-BINDING PROTEIN LIKE 13B n=1 Tax=Hibiscus trionum TaxID=183268 RepID=A0A9W7MLG4_HIBTR|nr:SQUAMOSA PROMOTER-BINDING PROTEIN LIKE 13, SQUAMOSA PROMOTER-BINDING PROTEIN LIKE 13B [Hibiscus trionum]